MYYMRLLVLLALQVALVHCFSWDIVVGIEKRLEFYYNGTLTHTEDIPWAKDIKSTSYDPVDYRVIFADNNNPNVSIYSFDLSTRKIQHLVTGTTTRDSVRVVYDPVTQLLFWKSGYSIYSFPLNPASSNKAVNGTLIATTDMYCLDIAVDSCRGYVYWITDFEIERVRFDGSERETLIEKYVFWRLSLAIDQYTQKMYWIEKISGNHLSIESADLNGKNGMTLYVIKNETNPKSLAVSKDYMYWRGDDQKTIWQLPRQHVEAKVFSIYHSVSCFDCQHIAAYYTIKEQTKGNQNCEYLKSLILNYSEPDSTVVSVLSSHGREVSEESRYESTPGYTGEKCSSSICDNYCMQGDCIVSAEGQPECRCNTGFSGERCEVNECHKHCLNSGVCSLNEEDKPVCECMDGYEGERCEFSICKDYCIQENCSVSVEGQPKCSCTNGYSGERCEFNACHEYCSNNGVCSLNEDNEPVCQCTAAYDGEKCDVPAVVMKCIQCVSMLRNMLNLDATLVTLGNGESSCGETFEMSENWRMFGSR